MAQFEPVINWVLYQEDDHRAPGKIVNLADGAGLTRLGLTQKWHWNDVPVDFFTVMPFKDAVIAAKSAYRKLYWEVLSCDQIQYNQIAAPLLSFAVNDNPLIAAKTLQAVLEVKEDGHLGPLTLATLNTKDPDITAALFRAEWLDFYHRLVQFKPEDRQFLNGWINRVNFPYPSSLVSDIYEVKND